MTKTIDFKYHLPNDVTLHATAEISPGYPPKKHGDDPYPGEPDTAEITECYIECEHGSLETFFPTDMFFRPYLSTKLQSIIEHMEITAIEKWMESQSNDR
jgi:hypothetical protein